jgi:Subtilase family
MLLVVLVCMTLVAVPLLMACSIRNPTATPMPTRALPATIGTPPSITLPSGNDVKIDSTLLDVAAAYNAGGQAAAEAKARETGLLSDKDELRLTLVLTDTNTQPVVDKVKSLGGKVAATAENLVDVLFPLQTAITSLSGANSQNFLQELASLTTVKEVRVTPLPHNEGFDFPTGTTIEEAQPLIQSMIVEGVAVSGADKWHAAGLNGKGVKIGIIDGAFGGYGSLLGKELPKSVQLKSFLPEGDAGDDIHGTAVAEIVYAMAPEAELYLCPIYGDASYIQAVKYLVDDAKVDVIQQSQGWHDTRGDGTDTRSTQVNYANDHGVVYVKSAGNEADAHYSATFNPGSTGRHQFDNGKDRIRVQGPSDDNVILLYLTWDAWSGEGVNYDLYLVDDAGTKVASSRNVQQGSNGKPPFEYIEYQGKPGVRYYAIIESVNTTRKVRLDLFGKNTSLENVGRGSTPVSSISSPGDARGAFTVGAVNFADDKLEEYSGQGPTFDGRRKPDIAGLARVTTTSYKGEPFYGTSAAAPHVSGAAALVIGAQPNATPDQVKAFLERNAKDLEEPGPENKTGYGRLALGPPEKATTTVQPDPSAAAAANGPAFADNFSSTQSGLQDRGETTYKDGRYVITPNAANRAAWATYGNSYTNATIEATVQLTAPAGGAAGLVFWQTGPSDYYASLVTGDGFYQVARLQGGRWAALTPWKQSSALKANEPNKLSVAFNGTQITLMANGQSLDTTQAPAAGNGRVGFIATNFAQPGMNATFDDFKATPGP